MLDFTLIEKELIFTESITGNRFSFTWTLKLEDSPFPDSLTFPYETPREYYGYRESLSEDDASQ